MTTDESAIGKYNCCETLGMNADRIPYFKKELLRRGVSESDAAIIFVNVDDVHGKQIAEGLMPGEDWQEIRDKGQVPFVRGLTSKENIQEMLLIFDHEAATKLEEMKGLAIVVVDYKVAEVFLA